MSTGKQGTSFYSSTPSRPPDSVKARLDRMSLDIAVDALFCSGLAVSTQQACRSGKKRYQEFCARLNVQALSATEQQLCQFVTCLAGDNLCHSTIKCYLRHLHLALEWADPGISRMARLEQVLRGVKYLQAKKRKPLAPLPITVDHLNLLNGVWAKDS